ncbi:MAG TPA: DNA-3-methyladenine glycosylase I [Mycobacteriales bacterium]|nr:DNA-3-methyladenine glycosylase I [Mycobacteriales bacterium]
MRCFGDGDELYSQYHDAEWGRPVRTEQGLYERICLEGFQAGLAWITVLRKRSALREVFHGFEPAVVAAMDVEPLLDDARLIRSRAKLQACVTNARATLALDGALVDLVWQHRHDGPAPATWESVPARTEASIALAKALKRTGFAFVGPTTAYAMLQACGVVNDHLIGCPVRADVEDRRASALS